MHLQHCFLCALPVLELKGQFAKLDSWHLLPGDDAFLKKAFGWCHTFCLARSAWDTYWFQRRRNHFLNHAGYASVASAEGAEMFRHRNTGQRLLLCRNGVTHVPTTRDLTQGKRVDGGTILPVAHELNITLDRAPVLRKCLLAHGRIALGDLVDSFGITDRQFSPLALADGELWVSDRQRRERIGNWVQAEVRYGLFLSDDLMALLETI